MNEQRKNVVLSRSQAKELCKDYRSLVGKNVKISNLNFQVVESTRMMNRAIIPKPSSPTPP